MYANSFSHLSAKVNLCLSVSYKPQVTYLKFNSINTREDPRIQSQFGISSFSLLLGYVFGSYYLHRRYEPSALATSYFIQSLQDDAAVIQ